MLLTSRSPLTSVYPVEVSGWDSSHTFFVEKADLAWSEQTGKRVILRRALRDGSVLFVRLIQPLAQERSYPVAFTAAEESPTPDGGTVFVLREIQTHQN
jgi:hypothetical protein